MDDSSSVHHSPMSALDLSASLADISQGSASHVALPNVNKPRPKDVVDDRPLFPPPPDKSDNAEIWTTYVKKADEHDAALLKRWNEGIDVFLLFTGLFSAILSAFLIASWSTLQPDSGQATVDGLVALSRQLTALSAGQRLSPSAEYQPQRFVPPWWAVAVNGLWFTSLMLSLVAAVLAMLVKEWLSAYNENIATLPIERVQQRQFRYDGLIKWSLPTVVSFLPLSIHIAVFLFFIGLALFTWTASIVLCVLTGSLLCISFSLYIASASAPLLFLDCPYKSPLSSVLGLVSRQARDFIQDIRRLFLPNYKPASMDLEMAQHEAPTADAARQNSPALEETKLQEITLQARAIAWLSTSADRDVREAALHFVARWRAPEAAWAVMREDIGRASLVLVQHYLSANGRETGEDDRRLETVALISSLCPSRQGRSAGAVAVPTGLLWDLDLRPPSRYLRDVVQMNIEECYGHISVANEYSSSQIDPVGLSILAESLHHHVQFRPGRWEADLLPAVRKFIVAVTASIRTNDTLALRACLFQFLRLLEHMLSPDGHEYCSHSMEWTSRYPDILPIGSLLVSCAIRLEKIWDPMAASAPARFQSLTASEFSSHAYELQRQFCSSSPCDLAGLLSASELRSLLGVVARRVVTCGSAAASESEAWERCFERQELVSCTARLFCAMGLVDIVTSCLRPALDCLEKMVQLSAGHHDVVYTVEGALRAPVAEWELLMVEFRGPSLYVRGGDLEKLVKLIKKETAPITLLAVFIGKQFLSYWIRWEDTPGMAEKMVLEELTSSGWLDCMAEFGVDYLLDFHRRHNDDDSSTLLSFFVQCVERFALHKLEEPKASALMLKYTEGKMRLDEERALERIRGIDPRGLPG